MKFILFTLVTAVLFSIQSQIFKLLSELLLGRIRVAIKYDKKVYSDFTTLLIGACSAYLSVIFAENGLKYFGIELQEHTIQLTTILLLIVYTLLYYSGLKNSFHEREAGNFKDIKVKNLSKVAVQTRVSNILKSSNSYMILGMALGFLFATEYWGFFNIDSTVIKIIIGYLFLGFLSTVELSGQLEPGAKGYIATFLVGLLVWPVFRVYYISKRLRI